MSITRKRLYCIKPIIFFLMTLPKYKLLDDLMESIQIISHDWIYLYINHTSAKLLNCTIEDTVGNKMSSIFPMDQVSQTEELFRKGLEEKISGTARVHFTFPRSNGNWYDMKVTPLPEGILISIMNVTDHESIQNKAKLAHQPFHRLIDDMPQVYSIVKIIFNKKGKVEDLLYLEPSITACQAVRLTPLELKDRYTTTFVWPISEEAKRYIQKAINTKTKQIYFTHIPKTNKHYKLTITPLENEYMSVTSIDITDLTSKKEELLSSVRPYTDIFSNTLEGYTSYKVLYDEDRKSVKELITLEMDSSAASAMDKTVEDFIGKPRGKTIVPIDYNLQRMIAKVMSGEEAKIEQYDPKSDKWSELNIYKIKHDQISIIGFDITKRKKDEKLLKEKGEIERDLLNNMLESYMVLKVVTSSSGAITNIIYESINNNAAIAIDLPKDRVEGQSQTTLHQKVLGEEYLEKINTVLSTNQSLSYETELADSGKWMDIKLYPLTGLNIIAVSYEDITIKKLREKDLIMVNKKIKIYNEERTKELVEALDREKQVSTMKSNFLSMVNHDMKAPLTSINVCLGIIERIVKKENNPILNKYTGYVADEIANMMKMINDFVSPTNRNILELNEGMNEINIVVYIDGILSGLSKLTKENQTIFFEHEGAELITTNHDIVRRIIHNLLANAIKYSEDDITLRTKLTKEYIYLSIQDKGIGIPVEDQSKIFTKFFRAKNTGDIMGNGLGLYILKAYVDELSGTMKFHSIENEGTTFLIHLPT